MTAISDQLELGAVEIAYEIIQTVWQIDALRL